MVWIHNFNYTKYQSWCIASLSEMGVCSCIVCSNNQVNLLRCVSQVIIDIGDQVHQLICEHIILVQYCWCQTFINILLRSGIYYD